MAESVVMLDRFSLIQKLSLAFISTFALFQIYAVGLTNDTMTMLFYTKHMITDGGLYSYWIEVNSPIIFSIYSLPYLLIKFINFTPAVAINLIVGLLCCINLYGVFQILGQSQLPQKQRHGVVLLCAWILFVLPILFIVYGDREHLLFVFTLPWVVATCLRIRPPIWVCVFAVIGFCVKPYNALIFILLALFCSSPQPFWQRIFSKTNIIIGGLGLAIVTLILLLYPEYLDIVQIGHTAYSEISLPFHYKRIFFLFAIAIAVVPLVFAKSVLIRNWFIWFIACGLVFLCNGGWQYTRYLFAAPIAMLYGGWMIGMFTHETNERNAYPLTPLPKAFLAKLGTILLFIYSQCRRVHLIPLLVILAVTAWSVKNLKDNMDSTSYSGFSRNYTTTDPRFLWDIRSAAGKHFMLLSIDIWGVNIAQLTGDPTQVFPYDHLWALPYAVNYANKPEAEPIRQSLFNAFKQTIKKYPDATIMVDHSPMLRSLPQNYSILDYFMQDEEIRNLMQNFQYVGTMNECGRLNMDRRCVFDFWKPKKEIPINH